MNWLRAFDIVFLGMVVLAIVGLIAVSARDHYESWEDLLRSWGAAIGTTILAIAIVAVLAVAITYAAMGHL